MISDDVLKGIARPRVGQVRDTATSVSRSISDIPGAIDKTPGLVEKPGKKALDIRAYSELPFVPVTSFIGSIRGGMMTARKPVSQSGTSSRYFSDNSSVIRRLKSSVTIYTTAGSYTIGQAVGISPLSARLIMTPGGIFASPIREMLGIQGQGDVIYDGYQGNTGRMVSAVSRIEAAIIDLPPEVRGTFSELRTSWGGAPEFTGSKTISRNGVTVEIAHGIKVFTEKGVEDMLIDQAISMLQRGNKVLRTVKIEVGSGLMPERIVVRSMQKETVKSGINQLGEFSRYTTSDEISAGERRTLPASSVRKQ